MGDCLSVGSWLIDFSMLITMAEWGNELLAMTGQLIRTTEAQRNMENKVNAFGFTIMLLRIYCIEQLELLR